MPKGSGRSLSREKARQLLRDPSRRDFLKASGVLALVVGIASGELSPNDEGGTLFGGKMALSQAYRLDPNGRHWIGPDSAKANVDPKAGRYFETTDTQIKYHGDGSAWVKMGIGSDSEQVPSVQTQQLSVGPDGPASSFAELGGLYREDANSPLTVSGTSSGTITLDGEYDAVLVICSDQGDSETNIDFRINGVSTNTYDRTGQNASTTTGNPEWRNFGEEDESRGQHWFFSGRWDDVATIATPQMKPGGVAGVNGQNDDVTSPLTSITLLENGGSNFVDISLRVYGIDYS